MMGRLYKIDFPNGKSYIGITDKAAEQRFAGHCAKNNKSLVSNAIRKYGAANILVRVLAIASDWEYLKAVERNAIRVYGTKSPNGYNLTDGGDGVLGYKHTPKHLATLAGKKPKGLIGYIFTEKDRIKISSAGKGRKHSPETKSKIAEANRRRIWTNESRVKLSVAHKGRVPPNKGLPMSDEQKAKISASKLAANKTLSEEHKRKIGEASSMRKGIRWSKEALAKGRATRARNARSKSFGLVEYYKQQTQDKEKVA